MNARPVQLPLLIVNQTGGITSQYTAEQLAQLARDAVRHQRESDGRLRAWRLGFHERANTPARLAVFYLAPARLAVFYLAPARLAVFYLTPAGNSRTLHVAI